MRLELLDRRGRPAVPAVILQLVGAAGVLAGLVPTRAFSCTTVAADRPGRR